MSRCETHCPTPAGFPWLAALIAAATLAAAWMLGQAAQTLGKTILITIAGSVLVAVTAMVIGMLATATTTTPPHIRRPRRSELPTPAAETPAPPVELEPATYPPLRAVPDHEERAA